MTKKLIMCKGLPGSGKSTWAEEYRKLDPANILVITKDDIRKELEKTGWKWSPENEKIVVSLRDDRITMGLGLGLTVISADTNYGKHETRLKELAAACDATFEVKDFTHLPVNTCIARNAQRTEGKVPEKVIWDMHNKYQAMPEIVPYVPNDKKPEAIIVDIDGTLALHNGRNPYDHAKAANDVLNWPIANIVRAIEADHVFVLLVTGRERKWEAQTKEFLTKNGVYWDTLIMRETGDNRRDDIVKYELFDTQIREHWNILFVLDDRDRVVKMWRKLGLTCLQVAEGGF